MPTLQQATTALQQAMNAYRQAQEDAAAARPDALRRLEEAEAADEAARRRLEQTYEHWMEFSAQMEREPGRDWFTRAQELRRLYIDAQRARRDAAEALRRAREAFDQLEANVRDAEGRLNQTYSEWWDAVTATFPLPTP